MSPSPSPHLHYLINLVHWSHLRNFKTQITRYTKRLWFHMSREWDQESVYEARFSLQMVWEQSLRDTSQIHQNLKLQMCHNMIFDALVPGNPSPEMNKQWVSCFRTSLNSCSSSLQNNIIIIIIIIIRALEPVFQAVYRPCQQLHAPSSAWPQWVEFKIPEAPSYKLQSRPPATSIQFSSVSITAELSPSAKCMKQQTWHRWVGHRLPSENF